MGKRVIKNLEEFSDEFLNELFEHEKDSSMDAIVRVFSLVLYKNSTNTDLVNLFKVLDLEDFVRVITLFDGKTVQLPTKEDLKEALTLSLVYYYRVIQGLSWEEIKKKFPYEISGGKYSVNIKSLNSFIRQKMNETFIRLYEEEK